MFNLTEQQKEKRAQKIAAEQGIGAGEAREILETLLNDVINAENTLNEVGQLAQNKSTTENGPEGGSETPEVNNSSEQEESSEETSLENKAVEKDFDIQMNADTMDKGSLETANNELATTMAKLRKLRQAKKAAFEDVQAPTTVDPREEQMNQATQVALEETPDMTPEEIQYAREMMAQMNLQDNGDPREQAALLQDIAGRGQNRVNAWLAKSLGPNLGIPRKEGKIYRSNVNPMLFRTAIGRTYKLAFDDYDSQIMSDETEPLGVTAPEYSMSTGSPEQQAEEVGNRYNLQPEQKQRLAQIITDAEGNGSSPWRLMGLVAGYLNDKGFTQIAPSDVEKAEMEAAFKEGSIARGGNTQIA